MSKLETDDVRIHFSEHGSAHGDLVLLLHGCPDNACTWNAVIALLPTNRYRLIVPTIRGFGKSVFKNDEAPRTANSGILARRPASRRQRTERIFGRSLNGYVVALFSSPTARLKKISRLP